DQLFTETLKYYAAVCQTDQPNPLHRSEMKRNTAHTLQMIDQAVVGYAPLLPVKLIVFPEFAHAAPVYLTVSRSSARSSLSRSPMNTRRRSMLRHTSMSFTCRLERCLKSIRNGRELSSTPPALLARRESSTNTER